MSISEAAVRATDTWGALRIGGADARAFLQGQLSNDLLSLTRDNSLLAALNTPQGRVVALLRLVERADAIYGLLPTAMVATVIERLRKYVLRSKVTLESSTLDVLPLIGIAHSEVHALFDGGARAATHLLAANVSALHLPGPTTRTLLIGEMRELRALLERAGLEPASWNDWRLAQIEAGEPQVYPATSEHFVAQMLNLDLVEGLSFNKGCYTGQEIIVRTQHLGRIKRRMVRARHSGSAVTPGDKLFDGDVSAGEVVDVAQRADGTTELLAVISLTHAPGAVHFAGFGPLTELALPYSYGSSKAP